MKKLLGITLSMMLTLGVSGLALAVEKTFTPEVSAELMGGYLKIPGTTINGYNYDDGAFFAQLNSLKLRLHTNISVSNELSAELISQYELYRARTEDNKDYESAASAIQNYGITYNPGIFKLNFDAKGREVMIGIPGEELLKLNVARRFVSESLNPDGEPNFYRYFVDNARQAKQLTLEVPFAKGRVVSVFSLEPTATSNGSAGAWVGGFGEVSLNKGKYALGYQAKMTGAYDYPVPAGYFVFATDYRFNNQVRLQLDYSTRDDDGQGYQVYFRPVDELDYYEGTPFTVTDQLNSKLTIYNYELAARLMNDKYVVGVSYNFKPWTVGVKYRNWAFNVENQQAKSDDYVAEIYGKYILREGRKNYLKAFYRTDESYGVYLVALFD